MSNVIYAEEKNGGYVEVEKSEAETTKRRRQKIRQYVIEAEDI